MKSLYTLLLIAFVSFSAKAQLSQWSYYEDTTGTLSSPKAADLNNDGILDIVMGSGAEDKTKVTTIAIDGSDGTLLWKSTNQNEVFGSAVFYDANKDKVPDVLMCGRTGILSCLNGANGNTIWEFFDRDKKEASDSGWHNFFQPQVLPDLNNDGYDDILVVNGGDKSKSYTDTVGRPAGNIMLISGKNGNVIAQIETPDGQEAYMAPVVHDFNNDSKLQVIFGSGGETMSGALWVIKLEDLLNENNKRAQRLAFTGKKGFIPPPAIADLNDDGFDDLIVNAYNGKIMAFSGEDFKKMWTVHEEGFETQCTPAIGNFTGSHHPDVLTVLFKGNAPNFKDYMQVLIDGQSGKVVWMDSLSDLQFASPNAFDYDNDGFDEALFSFNYLSGSDFTHSLSVYDFQTNKETLLVSGEKGINLSSTPLISDLDGNGQVDIVYSVRKSTTNPIATDGIYIKMIPGVSRMPAWGIAWGGYLGANNSSQYNFEGQICSISKLDISLSKKQPSCNGYKDGYLGIIASKGQKPYVYNWNDGNTSAIRDKLGQGVYYVRTMDNSGCYSIDTFKLKDPYEINIFGDSTFCEGEASGNARITSSGCVCANSGCKYVWNTGGEDHGLYGVKAGTYTVILTHTDGCVVYDTVTVFNASPILDSVRKFNISCYGEDDGRIELFPADSMDFRAKWFHGVKANFLDSLVADTYRVELRDWRWCFDTLEFVIKEPKPLQKTIVDYTHVNCFGDSTGSIEVSAQGGWKPYSFFNGVKGQKDSLIDVLKAGDYDVYAVDSAGCYTDTQTVALFERAKIELAFGSTPQTDPFNENGKAWVKATGGLAPYKYLWNFNATTNDTLFGVKANTYKVKATDSLGCIASGEVVVDFSTSTGNQVEQDLFLAYPIPIKNTLFIKANESSLIRLTNLSGKIIYEQMAGSSITSIDCSDLTPGVYLLQCRHEEEMKTIKIFVD